MTTNEGTKERKRTNQKLLQSNMLFLETNQKITEDLLEGHWKSTDLWSSAKVEKIRAQ